MMRSGLRTRLWAGSLLMLSTAALAGDGLAGGGLGVVTPEIWWPQWQARVALHTSSWSPITLAPVEGRQAVGASLLGDYTIATPGFGSFRASGGLLFGGTGGAPMLLSGGSSRVALSLLHSTSLAADSSTLPYLGLGFSSRLFGPQLALTADMGWIAERPGALGNLGRAVFGSAGAAEAWRELRVSPVLQLGLRYAF